MVESTLGTFYSGTEKILVAVNCVIFGFDQRSLKLLLLKRSIEPAKGRWAIMGGFVKNEESLDDSARRILKQLTGLDQVFMEQLHGFGDVNRDPGGRVISVAYYALIRVDTQDHRLVEEHGAHWIALNELPELIFDHGAMMDMALQQLRMKARFGPIGFELLPEKFTLPDLQSLYEAIYQEELDKRNFRKKIISMNLLEKLTDKDKSTSRKGAFFYRFDKEKYESLLKKGFNFEL